MNVNQMFPSKWVKAEDIGNRRVTVTIAKLTQEEVQQEKGKATAWALWFRGAKKGLLLNKTNADTIASLYGPETDDWMGKAIDLYTAQVKAFGENHTVVRVSKHLPAPHVANTQPAEVLPEDEELWDEEEVPA